MHTARHATLLSLALLAGACGTKPDQTAAVPDDLKRDLAAAAASSGALAAPPPGYQPARFVSSVERAHTASRAKRAVLAHHRTKPAPVRRPASGTLAESAPDPSESTVAEAPAAVVAPESPTPEPTIVVHQPTTEPSESGGTVGGGDYGRGGGWGGIIGAIGGAVIRGGVGTVDKCDPRTHGRRGRIPVIDGPDLGMPIPIGHPTFPRMPRR